MRSFAEQSCRGVDTAFSDCSSSWRSRRRERFKRVAILEVVDVDVSSRLVGVDSVARAGRGGEPSAVEPTGGSRGIRRLWLAAPTTDLPSIGRDQVADPVPVTPSPRHAVAPFTGCPYLSSGETLHTMWTHASVGQQERECYGRKTMFYLTTSCQPEYEVL